MTQEEQELRRIIREQHKTIANLQALLDHARDYIVYRTVDWDDEDPGFGIHPELYRYFKE